MVSFTVHDAPSGIPAGSTCTGTEDLVYGAVGPSIPTTSNAPVTIPPTGSGNLEFVNHYSAGTVSVKKTVSGTGADSAAVQNAQFTFNVKCELDVPSGPQGSMTRLLITNQTLTVGVGQTATATDPTGAPLMVPGGSHCYATEIDAQGANQTTISHYSFETGAVVTLDPGEGHFRENQAVTIEATNIFDGPASAAGLAVAGSELAGIIALGAIVIGAGIILLLVIRRRSA